MPLLVAIFYGATRDMVAVKKVEKGYQKLGLYHQFSLVEKKSLNLMASIIELSDHFLSKMRKLSNR